MEGKSFNKKHKWKNYVAHFRMDDGVDHFTITVRRIGRGNVAMWQTMFEWSEIGIPFDNLEKLIDKDVTVKEYENTLTVTLSKIVSFVLQETKIACSCIHSDEDIVFAKKTIRTLQQQMHSGANENDSGENSDDVVKFGIIDLHDGVDHPLCDESVVHYQLNTALRLCKLNGIIRVNTNNNSICTLPKEIRPKTMSSFCCCCSIAGNTVIVIVYPNGNVMLSKIAEEIRIISLQEIQYFV